MKHIAIERSTYLDSVTLMRISKKAGELAGIRNAMAAMATDTNLALLAEIGFDRSTVRGANPSDLIIAIDAEHESALQTALGLVRDELKGGVSQPAPGRGVPRSLERAVRDYPEINLVLISVPGQFAAYEARSALSHDKHVMIFSDNVSLEDERDLKALASRRGLLLMGPDCGTAIISGVGLGFANSVPRGSVGMVAASGTGAQEVSSILARSGIGISQLVGTGGRDVSEAIGGTMMLMGLGALVEDDETDVIVIVSKLPDPEVAAKILRVAKEGKKPCVIHFAGYSASGTDSNLGFARTLAETAVQSALAAGTSIRISESAAERLREDIRERKCGQPHSRRFLRGLFSGGTLAQEAAFLLGPVLGKIHTNLGLPGMPMLDDPAASAGHTIVDLGDDVFTRGRAHPMLDQSYRLTRLVKEASDPETAVVLLDVVLGYGCSDDPAGEIAETLKKVSGAEGSGAGEPVVIASICGTHGDPQDYGRQREALESAGVIVAETNAGACDLAREALAGTGDE